MYKVDGELTSHLKRLSSKSRTDLAIAGKGEALGLDEIFSGNDVRNNSIVVTGERAVIFFMTK
jgi:hypothetical protein